jgi:hypothetical protein
MVKGVFGLTGLGVTGDLINFDDAPGGDTYLDDIFGDPSRTPTTTEPTANQPQSTAPVTTQTPEPVIKTKTGTVYKTIEDAVSGIEHKDALIAQLREQAKQTTGRDPLAARPPVTQPSGPKSYLEDEDQYFADIAEAVTNKNTKAYMQAQQKLTWDILGPLAPTITSLARANAEQIVSRDIPEFKGFRNSEQYTQLEQESPLLADAIRSAEMNPQASSQLPELYRVAYLASQGRRVPELLQSVRTDNPSVQPRPTVHSTQVSPPVVTGIPVSPPSLDSREGRKALIDRMEGQGIGNLKW